MAETKVAPTNIKVKIPRVGGKPRLPKGTKKLANRGLISEKQMAKLKGEA